MIHHNLARRLTAGVVVLLGLLLFLQHHTFAELEPANKTPATLSLSDHTSTPIPRQHPGPIETFDSLARIWINPMLDEKTASDQVAAMQALSPQADCTGVTNGACVETRAGLSLCNLNNICVIKVDLNRNTLQPRVVIAPAGHRAWLSSMATSVGGIAAINGDYFSPAGCPDNSPPLNCGEGLTFVEGTDYTDYSGSEWQNRRSLGLNGNYDPNVGWPNEQNDYHWFTLGGGPQVTFGGEYRWRCSYQGYNTDGDCTCDGTTVVINDEFFGCSATNWWNRPQSFVGYSEDRNTLYLAASQPGYNKTPRQMHDVLWVHGARTTLRLDGGTSSGLYFNDGAYSFAWNGGQEVPNAWVIVPYSVPPSPTPPPAGSWHVEYFSDRNLGGRCYDGYESSTYVVKQWGTAGPTGGCPNDSFSARFTRTMNFPGGSYRLHCQHDDGCRIFIDGQLRLDAWWDSSFTGHDWGGTLSSGNHEVKVEFYENTGDARLEAWWQGAGYLPAEQGCTTGEWCAESWGNVDLQGAAFMRFNEGVGVLDHNWGASGPGTPYGLPGDRFSNRFQRTVGFACGRYRFNVFSDDGVRLWVGNQLLLDQWHPQAASFQVEADLVAGNAVVKIEHYEDAGGAGIHLDWQQISSCATPTPTVTHTPTPSPTVTPTATPSVYPTEYWRGEYWNNETLAGSPVLVRSDNVINFDWQYGSPAANINVDHFSGRWTRRITFAIGGSYEFSVWRDDGARLWIDGVLVFDEWQWGHQQHVFPVNLTPGQHDLRFEAYEIDGYAMAILAWTTPAPTPTATVCPDYTPPPGIGVEDIQMIVAHWGETPASPGWEARFDLNGDGRVDIIDIMRTDAVWGTGC